MRPPPTRFHLLAKPSGATCNLDCTYCFFLWKKALYPDDASRMSEATLQAYIAQLLESHRTPEVTVAWQGGEPTLMGLDFFRRSVELVEQYERPGQRIEYTMQTNGASGRKGRPLGLVSVRKDRHAGDGSGPVADGEEPGDGRVATGVHLGPVARYRTAVPLHLDAAVRPAVSTIMGGRVVV